MRLASLLTCLLLPLLLLAGREQAPPTRAVKIRLVDAQSGAELPGLIRITGPDGEAVGLPSLLSRGVGLLQQQPQLRPQLHRTDPRRRRVSGPGANLP